MAVIDVFTYNGENDMLRLHLSTLDSYVDTFIIVEANKTFTGNPKPLYFFRDQRFFKQWWHKIEYYPVESWDDVSIWEQAIMSPNTQGAEHWKREFYIKESIQKALQKANVQDDDLLFIGDVDEIIDPTVEFRSESPVKAKLRVYAYWLNNRSTEPFWGTLITQYKDIKDRCLNHVRSDTSLNSQGDYLGWHFTNIMSVDKLRDKLNDSYTPESYNTYQVQHMLAERHKNNQDYLGRPFQFHTEESEWPLYLQEHKPKFQHLCK